jgi:hypothetical protein
MHIVHRVIDKNIYQWPPPTYFGQNLAQLPRFERSLVSRLQRIADAGQMVQSYVISELALN